MYIVQYNRGVIKYYGKIWMTKKSMCIFYYCVIESTEIMRESKGSPTRLGRIIIDLMGQPHENKENYW